MVDVSLAFRCLSRFSFALDSAWHGHAVDIIGLHGKGQGGVIRLAVDQGEVGVF